MSIKNSINFESLTYNQFISNFPVYQTIKLAEKARPKDTYTEIHHIIPLIVQKQENYQVIDESCVILTAYEHLIAHYLFSKENSKYAFIFYKMMRLQAVKLSDLEQVSLNSLQDLARLKEAGHQYLKEKMTGSNNPMYNHQYSEETREKMRRNHANFSGEKNPNYGRKVSEETREKMRQAKLGKPTWNKGNHNYRLGTTLPSQVKEKISKSHQGRKWYNNGIINICQFQCPEGFTPGRIKN